MIEKRENLDRREQIDELLEMRDDIKKMVALLNEMEGFFAIIVKFGKFLKWTLGIVGACFATWAAWKGLRIHD